MTIKYVHTDIYILCNVFDISIKYIVNYVNLCSDVYLYLYIYIYIYHSCDVGAWSVSSSCGMVFEIMFAY